jgi:hypothetical protein
LVVEDAELVTVALVLSAAGSAHEAAKTVKDKMPIAIFFTCFSSKMFFLKLFRKLRAPQRLGGIF